MNKLNLDKTATMAKHEDIEGVNRDVKGLDLNVSDVNISLSVLMGLPASGKTTLGTKIVFECTEGGIVVIRMSYDEFIPHEVQAKCALLSENNVAKIVRSKFMQCVEFLVTELKIRKRANKGTRFPPRDAGKVKDLEDLLNCSPETEDLIPNKSFLSKVEEILNNVNEQLEAKRWEGVVLLIDDNNYYSSMRNEFYRIAKAHRTGFSIIFCRTSVRTCRKRNSERESKFKVPDETIVAMSLKLEEPNPMKSVCDSFCVQVSEITDAAEVEEDNVLLITEVVRNSLKHPIDWTPPPNRSEEIERERRICSENEIHQADQVLRKWVNKELTLSTFKASCAGKSKKEAGRDIRRRKDMVLCKLRSGEFTLSSGVTQDVEFAQEVIQLAWSVSLN